VLLGVEPTILEAQDRAGAEPEKGVAPEALALLRGLEQERRAAAAELQEGRDGRLAIVDEGVAHGDHVVVACQLTRLVECRAEWDL
jgi:hypothetical protein